MEQVFTTTTGQLTIKNGKLWEKKLVTQDPDYRYHSFILLALFTILCIHEISTSRNYARLLILLPISMWIYPHFKTIYQFLFQKIWRWYIPLAEISKLQYNPDFNELEESITVRIKSGRSKIFIFRKSEKQAEEMMKALQYTILSPDLV